MFIYNLYKRMTIRNIAIQNLELKMFNLMPEFGVVDDVLVFAEVVLVFVSIEHFEE